MTKSGRVEKLASHARQPAFPVSRDWNAATRHKARTTARRTAERP